MRRRLLAGTTAFVALTGTLLVLPVSAEPTPEAVPVETSVEEVAMGSLSDPAPEAQVQEGTTDPVAGVPDAVPTLSVSATDVAQFSLVGVTWAYDPAVTDTVVQVRVRDLAGTWGAWTEVGAEAAEQEAGMDTGTPVRGGTAPLWTGPATAVEAELVTRSGAQPADVQLDLVDPGESAADDSLGTPDITETADAATAMPPVFSRTQWGADERIMGWRPQYASTIKAATLHHTAGSNSYTAGDVPAILRSTYTYHAQSLGWGDIGYNVLVDKFGRLWEGRAGGLASTVIGAHAGGFNTGTFGVSMMGNYDAVDTPQPMVDAVAAIIAWKFSLFNVAPNGTTTLTSGGTDKYPAGTAVRLPTIFGHRDTKSTACPGRYGYARLPEIRGKVAAGLSSAAPLIQRRYDSDAGVRSVLGAVTTPPTSTPDGVGAYAHYANGSMYATAATGAQVVRGPVRDRWAAAGWERSGLGYPVGDTHCGLARGGCYQHFQGGSIYWTQATGARIVSGPLRDRWAAAGWEGSGLGYPVTDVQPLGGGGQFAHFQGGSVYWSAATGARIVYGVVRDRWAAAGWETGALGYPTTDVQSLPSGGLYAHFQRGSIYWTAGTGARVVLTPLRDRWAAAGWEGGSLGYPVADQAATPGGAGQVVAFQRGWVYWSAATGGRVLDAVLRDAWLAAGGDGGALGLPVGDAGVTPDGRARAAHFQGGSIYVHDSLGVRVLPRAVVAAWEATGWELGPLGYPTADAVPAAGGAGSVLAFQGGQVYQTASGAHALWGAVLTRYRAGGGADGVLGLPVTGVRSLPGGGLFAHFQHGSIYWTQATGARIVSEPVRDRWAAAGWEGGVLGYPTTDVLTLPGGGLFAHFQRGSIYWTQATGARIVSGPVRDRWAAAGWEGGVLGYPTTDVLTLPGGGLFAHFQHGSIYSTQATGARLVPIAVRDAWAATGWENGRLGYPTGDPQAVAGGTRQTFQGGTVTVSATGQATVSYR